MLYEVITSKFEEHFKVNIDEANIVGAFEAIIELQISIRELFNIFVENDDFLRFYGQTVKKINNLYIVNYDLPAILGEYNDKTNVFIIVIRLKDNKFNFSSYNFV